MKRALIVGASGQDGRLLGELLLSKGYLVHGLTRIAPSADLPWECSQINILDSTDVDACLGKTRPDEIYYLAAFHHSAQDKISMSVRDLFQRSFDVHVYGLTNFLETIKTKFPMTRLFYASSSHVFGLPSQEKQTESTPVIPISPYGISKAAGMACCRHYREHGSIHASAGILYNHESNLRNVEFLSRKITDGIGKIMHNRDHKIILGDLNARVDWGYAPDYVEAMLQIVQMPYADDYIIATGESHSVEEFVEKAFECVGLDWRNHVEEDSQILWNKRLGGPLVGDSTKLRQSTGWMPTVTFAEMVCKLVNYHLAEMLK
ncbi:MAG: GDP-mannose 4,6-dehydratase [Syntrophobacteraceae bacterium]|nr:GDP-mannose 4,6-dehydratase [Syntrophobacteraceae bacterium]MDR3561365.1 GDP-mannose 4,6-dehydratase [Negativicutes bacterium]